MGTGSGARITSNNQRRENIDGKIGLKIFSLIHEIVLYWVNIPQYKSYSRDGNQTTFIGYFPTGQIENELYSMDPIYFPT